jgi:uncharacterized protein
VIWVKVCLHDFRGTEELVRDFRDVEKWPALEFQGQTVEFPGDVELDFHLEGHAGQLVLSGRVVARLRLACGRCAEWFDFPVDLKLSDEISLESADDPDEHWSSSYLDPKRDELDLTEYALLSIVERLPLKPLCRMDCRGLCPVCGQNLNLADCGCQSEQLDPRLAILGKLLKHDQDRPE